MKRYFAPNIDGKGRLVRGLMGLALLVGAALAFARSTRLGIPLLASGLFGLFEAVHGWCLAQASDIKMSPMNLCKSA